MTRRCAQHPTVTTERHQTTGNLLCRVKFPRSLDGAGRPGEGALHSVFTIAFLNRSHTNVPQLAEKPSQDTRHTR